MKTINLLEKTIGVNTTIHGGVRTVYLPFFTSASASIKKTTSTVSITLGDTVVFLLEDLSKEESVKIEEKLLSLSKQTLDLGECLLVLSDTIVKPYETVALLQPLYNDNSFDLDKLVEYLLP